MTVSVGLTAGRGLVDDGRVTGEGEGRGGRPDPEVPAKARRRVFSAAYKLRILAEYEAAPDGRKGEILRRERLYSAHIVEWRKARNAGALAGLSTPRGRPATDGRDREIAALRAEKDRLEKELAKAQFVIDVQGKVNALLEKLSESAPDEPTGRNSSPNSNG
jgi:transposase-like protein